MAKPNDINAVLARNLTYWMSRPGASYRNANALGTAAGIAPNTIRNYLDAKKRTVTTEKPDGYPTLDKLAILAEKLGCAVWELLHPDIEQSLRERQMYKHVAKDFERIRDEAKTAADAKPVSRLRLS